MKQIGREITGDNIKVDDLTKTWRQVRLSPNTFYRKQDEFVKAFKKFEGLYAAMDMGHSVVLRMNSEDDADKFIKKYYEYL